jgi:hypothetical protein
MKKILVLFIVNCMASYCIAQVNIYSALTIPDSLKKDANAVVRDEYIKFTIRDINTAKFEIHEVITILNSTGSYYLNFREFSYKFKVLDDAEIIVYDALGNKMNTYTKKEMTSLNYGEGLVPEGKLTYFSVTAPSYPITVETNYSYKYKGLYSYPTNYFQVPYSSVQKAIFEVEAPASLSFRYKVLNCDLKPMITHAGGNDVYRWETKDLKAFKVERNSGASDNYIPQVLLAPNKFQLDEYQGDMTSWKNFGDWMNNLYAKTITLPEDRKQFYQALVKNVTTDKEKARILYDYLQNNMRYVSIQLGIGGLRPFPASFVDDKKYGDCKALSNYLKSALDAVGIRSNVVIIEGSNTPRTVLEDFPADYFNHVILCIPQPKDTIWLECTSTTLPFAELGPFTENRKAMMVTDNGGVLVNTPMSNYKANTESVNTVIEVNADGGAKVNTRCTLKGDGRDNLLMYFHDLKNDEKKKYFINQMEWKQPDVFEITTSPNKNDPYVVSARMEYEKIFSFNAGSKLFFEPRLYSIFDEEIPEYEKRIRDYYFTCPYQSFDTTVYKFPEGYTMEMMPKNKSVVKPFAQYTCTYTWDANTHTLNTVASLQIKERVIKAVDYPALYDFNKQVLADMNEKIVMKKQ